MCYPPSPTDSNRFVAPRRILQLSLFEEAVLWRTLELELRNLVLVSLVRVVCPIMGSFRSADQLVHGIETEVSRRSSDHDSVASMGRAGFLSAPCTLVKPTRSRRFQSIRVHSLVMMNSPYG